MAIPLSELVKKLSSEHPPKSNAKHDYIAAYRKLVELGRPFTPSEAAKVTGIKYSYIYGWLKRHTIDIEEAQKLVDEGKTDAVALLKAGSVFIPLQTAIKIAQNA